MAKKQPAAPATGISLRTPGTVLAYSGLPVFGDAPARDLGAGDLAYVWRVGALRASGGQPVAAATPTDLEAIATELVATGAFIRIVEAPAAPVEPVAPARDPAGANAPVTESPAGPATTEEQPDE